MKNTNESFENELDEELSAGILVINKTMEKLAYSDFPKNVAILLFRLKEELCNVGFSEQDALAIVKNYKLDNNKS